MDDRTRMRWPGLRRKLLPVTALRMQGWAFWADAGGNDHFGNWWSLRIGPWLLVGGTGTYD